MPALLELGGLRKAFGGSQALAGVDLRIEGGQVHGLLGANGSGKSTIIKVLAGYHAPDAGTLTVRGEPVDLPLAAGQPQQLGLAFVHQDLGMVASLSVLDNFLIGSLSASRRTHWVNWRAARRSMRLVLQRYGLELDPDRLVGDLRPVDRALLAIVRALESPGVPTTGAKLIVLDEPTVFLPSAEVQQLFDLVRRVTAEGSSVLFVSHDLDEVREITDRITVLRNGKVALTGVTAELSVDQLVEAIVGTRLGLDSQLPASVASRGEAALVVDGLSAGGVEQVSFTAAAGEVVGLTGLLGSGYEDVVRALAGALPATGTLRLDGTLAQLPSWTAHRAIAAGVALIPGDRLHEGAIADLPLSDNLTMPALGSFVRRGVLDRRAMVSASRGLAERFDVRPPDPRALLGALSGGNQQKVVLGKWLSTDPRLLLLHEPTQGVDIGARKQIFQTIRETAASRVALCASSDHDQLAELCDRVLVFRRGRIAIELSGQDVTKSRITEECLRGGRERNPDE
jgi:ribose transport system ATP-binding protein